MNDTAKADARVVMFTRGVGGGKGDDEEDDEDDEDDDCDAASFAGGASVKADADTIVTATGMEAVVVPAVATAVEVDGDVVSGDTAPIEVGGSSMARLPIRAVRRPS